MLFRSARVSEKARARARAMINGASRHQSSLSLSLWLSRSLWLALPLSHMRSDKQPYRLLDRRLESCFVGDIDTDRESSFSELGDDRVEHGLSTSQESNRCSTLVVVSSSGEADARRGASDDDPEALELRASSSSSSGGGGHWWMEGFRRCEREAAARGMVLGDRGYDDDYTRDYVAERDEDEKEDDDDDEEATL